MKIISRTIPLLFVLILGAAASASAQSSLSAFFGLGSAWDTAAPGCIYTFYEGETTPAGPCTYNGEPTNGYAPPALGGVIGVFGADFMFSHYLGAGGEYSFGFAQRPYADVNYRPEFYDFNLLYHPINTRRVVLEIQGGIGGFDTKFYIPNSCSAEGCGGGGYFNTADHFQVHVGAGLKIYVRGGVFVKPQFDLHIVPNLSGPVISGSSVPSEQFGSDWVPEATVAVGYTFGER